MNFFLKTELIDLNDIHLKYDEILEKNNGEYDIKVYLNGIPDSVIPAYCKIRTEANIKVPYLIPSNQNPKVKKKDILKQQKNLKNDHLRIDIFLNRKNKKEIVGIINGWGHAQGSFFEFAFLYIKEGHKNKKLGSLLTYKLILEILTNYNRVEKLSCETLETNSNALKILNHIGFRTIQKS